MKVLIGNYPYKHINFDKVLNSFKENCRFNMLQLNENNGDKCDELCVCNHIYENIKNVFYNKNNTRIQTFDYLYSKYKHAYTKEHVFKFCQTFEPSQYKLIYIQNRKHEIKNILKNIQCQ